MKKFLLLSLSFLFSVIIQAQNITFSSTSTTATIGQPTPNSNITFVSNKSITFAITSNQPWLSGQLGYGSNTLSTGSTTAGTTGNLLVFFSVSANPCPSNVGILTITYGDGTSQNITVTATETTPLISSISASTASLTATNGSSATIPFTVTSYYTSYDAISNQSWLTTSLSSTTTTARTLTITATENTETTPRTAIVTVSPSCACGASKTITVTQAGRLTNISDTYFNFPLDGNAVDVSGNGLTGTIVGGVTPTTDRFGNTTGAMNFNGTTGYIGIPLTTGVGTSDYTVSYWAMPDATNAGYVLTKEQSGVGTNQFRFGGTGSYFSVFSDASSNTIGSNITYTPTAAVWAHYVIVRKGTSIQLFVNGILQSSITSSQILNNSNTVGYGIGVQSSGTVTFKGSIDDLRMFKHALNTNEIQSLYTGLMADYPFNNSITDKSPLNWASNVGTSTTFTTDRFGTNTALNFDATTNTGVTLTGSSSSFNIEPIGISLWFNTASSNSGALLNKYVASSANGFNITLESGYLKVWYYKNGTNAILAESCNANVTLNTWNHLVVNYDNTGAKIYLNGTLVTPSTGGLWSGTQGPPTTTENVRFGNYPGGTNYTGKLDDIKIYNHILSASEIAALYSPNNRALDLTNSLVPATATTGKYVSVPSGAWFKNDFTVDSWVYLRSYDAYSRLFDFGNDPTTTNNQAFVLADNNGYPYFAVHNNGNSSYTLNTKIALNTWTHVAMAVKGDTASFYINGVNVGNSYFANKASGIVTNSNFIGRSPWNSDYHANAMIDEFRIYDYALSKDSIIARSHRNLLGNEAGLKLYYSFNEINGNTIPNLATATTNGDGTIINNAALSTSLALITPFVRKPTAITTSSITINWDKVPSAISYNFVYATNSAFTSATTVTGITTNNKIITGLTAGTLYYYKVQAVSTTQTSEYSTDYAYTTFTPPGNALTCNGNNIVNCQLNSNLANTFTIETWVAPNATCLNGAFHAFLGGGAPTIPAMYVYGNQFHWKFYNASNGLTLGAVIPGFFVKADEWVHVSIVCDGTTVKAYKNGVLMNTTTIAQPFSLSPQSTFYIGQYDNSFNGQIDELRIWNVARTEQELNATLHTTLAGTETGLLAYYNFDRSTLGIVPDVTTKNPNGIFTEVTPSWVASKALVTPFIKTPTSVGVKEFTANWDVIPNATSYQIQYSTSNTFSNILSTTNVNTNSYSKNGLTLGSKYYYRVNATVGSFVSNWATDSINLSPYIWVPASNNALNLDSKDDYVNLSSSPLLNNISGSSSITVSAWVNPTAGKAVIFNKWRDGTSGSHQIDLTISGSYVDAAFDKNGTGGWQQVISKSIIPDNVWTHVAFTRANNIVSIYINGVLDATTTLNPYFTTSQASTGPASIGGNGLLLGYGAASIDEVSIWNVALTQAQIANYMTSTIPNPTTASGLIAYYQFNQGISNETNTSITTLNDASVNKLNGTFTNLALTGGTSNFVAGVPAINPQNTSTATIASTIYSTTNTTVVANNAWKATSNQSWLTVNQPSGLAGISTETFTANTANPTVSPRTATVTFASLGTIYHTITITQAGADTTLSVSPLIANLGKAANSSKDINVTSNANWVTTSSDTSWLKVSPSSATLDKTITITANSVNPLITPRIATVTVKVNSNTLKTITVTQDAGDTTLTVLAPTINLDNVINASATATVTSNATWTATSSAPWLSIAKIGNGTFTYTTTLANTTTAARTAIITLKVSNNTLSTFTVTQAASIPTLSVSTTNNALNFDGSDDYVKADLATSAINNITMEAWINWAGSNSKEQFIILNGDGSNGYGIYIDGTHNNYLYGILCGNVYLSSTQTLIPNKWNHVALVCSAGTWAMYLNGTAVPIANSAYNAYTPKTGTFIGANNVNKFNFNGTIDEVRIWNIARSQNDIANSMYTPIASPASEGGLVAYYNFNQGIPNGVNATNTTAIDSSLTPKNGILTNFALTGSTSNYVTGAPLQTTKTTSTATLAKVANSSTIATIVSNTSWTASSPQLWLSLSASSGTGNSTLTLTANSANTTIAPRIATVTISATGVTSQTITVTQEKGDTTLTLSSNDVNIAKLVGSTSSIIVNSNASWTVISIPSWLSVTPSSSTLDATLQIKALENNPTTTARSEQVEVQISKNISKFFKVTQSGNDSSIAVSTNTVTLGKGNGTNKNVSVTSTTKWIASPDQDWLDVSPSSFIDGDSVIKIMTKSANPTIAPRTATVQVKASAMVLQYITVTQEAGDTTLTVSSNSASIAKIANSTASINVTSNATWTTNSNSGWLTVNPNSATTNDKTIILTAESNPTIAPRYAEVTVIVSNQIADTIKVTQEKGDTVLTSSASTASLTKENGSTCSITVNSNATWTIPTFESWLSVKQNNLSNTSTELVFTALEANPTINVRTASVFVKVSDNKYITLKITQAAGDATLSVAKSNLEIGSAALSKISTDITSNTTWSASSDKGWISLNPNSLTTNSATLTFTADKNPTVLTRTANIVVSATGVTPKTIVITQLAGEPTLSLYRKIKCFERCK